MRKLILTLVAALSIGTAATAQNNTDRIGIGFGALYERGLDVTIS